MSRPSSTAKVIPEDVSLLFAKGDIAKVDYISGSNSNEASLAPSLGTDLVKMPSDTGDALPMVRAIYEKSGALTDAEFGRQFFGDALFTGAAQALAGFVAKAGGTAHVYHFAYIADPLRGKDPGVGHGGEIAYVFGLRKLGFIANLATDKDRGVIALTQTYWTNFARTGDPNGAGLPQWPSFSQADQQTLVFDDQTKAIADFRRGPGRHHASRLAQARGNSLIVIPRRGSLASRAIRGKGTQVVKLLRCPNRCAVSFFGTPTDVSPPGSPSLTPRASHAALAGDDRASFNPARTPAPSDTRSPAASGAPGDRGRRRTGDQPRAALGAGDAVGALRRETVGEDIVRARGEQQQPVRRHQASPPAALICDYAFAPGSRSLRDFTKGGGSAMTMSNVSFAAPRRSISSNTSALMNLAESPFAAADSSASASAGAELSTPITSFAPPLAAASAKPPV